MTHHHSNIGIFRIHLYFVVYWWCSYFFFILLICVLLFQLEMLAFLVRLFMMISSSAFICLKNSLSLLQISSRTLPSTVFLIDSFFISILNISSHCLLACKVSAEKYTDNLTVAPLYLRSCFSLCL